MNKITCLMLLVHSGFLIAQTKVVVTQNGEKVTINPNIDNGLTATNGTIQLGGDLIKPSVLTTTSTSTLAIKGLQAGADTDNIIVSDTNGILKYVAGSNFLAASKIMGIQVISDNYTVAETDFTIIASKLKGDITITLPTASQNTGRILVINQIDIGANSNSGVIVKFDVPIIYSDTISKNQIISDFYSSSTGGNLKVTLQSDGKNWYSISL